MNNLNISIKSKKVKRVVDINILISFIISGIGLVMLWLYNTYYISIYLFEASIIIYRTGLLMGIFSIIYGIFFENYLNCG